MPLTTERLILEPLTVAAADEMVGVLGDPSLHRFTGGSPEDLVALRRRYERQVKGRSGDGSERWLNWIVRRADTRDAVGYVQATVKPASYVAGVAWVIGVPFQGRGYASEAASALVDWLRVEGIGTVTAHIHPDNRPSEAVARRAGFEPTSLVEHGELVWEARRLRPPHEQLDA